jgi:hypothetical protein
VKRNEETKVSERVADGMLTNNARDFWSEIDCIWSNKSGSSRIVDNETEASNIAKVFADKYRELYTSVPYDADEMQSIIIDINSLL